jgi:hypothetical protein
MMGKGELSGRWNFNLGVDMLFWTLLTSGDAVENPCDSNRNANPCMFSTFIDYMSEHIQFRTDKLHCNQLTNDTVSLGSKVNVDRRTTKDEKTTETVAGATDRLRVANHMFVSCISLFNEWGYKPRGATDTNDSEGAASETNLASDRTEDNAEKTSKESDDGVAGVLNGVACRVGENAFNGWYRS